VTTFIGSNVGDWHVKELKPIRGESIPSVSRLQIEDHPTSVQLTGIWKLCGFVSNIRYANQSERKKILAIQEGLGRPQATCAALIPIRKNEAWWNLAQDERRAIFEEQSHHTAIGLQYLPAISRKLYHCRDLGEPFDFLTWFEYAPKDAAAFEELVIALRHTEEWKYVEREVDIRLIKV
jgi:chlorite dismutase